MNMTLKIIKQKDLSGSISSNDEAMQCLKTIQNNFSQTKSELREIGLLNGDGQLIHSHAELSLCA
ncbi:hypothetical protein [Polynucleobacter sp. MWH-UH35A]|uniref:hypothetical protein n=1 Tax=Polynucleobacter sp. MWH-UH35A TaxID=1855619 RepID=UPI001BFE8407|nr:hypothetical protein [Polynucleobacter sp. MWH-UH35A]QWD60794.1 hypothetical protein ICV36_03665 [Polynucleobacter sp. MWH-UH35A]